MVLREALSAVARNEALGAALVRTPGAREVVRRVVGGTSLDEAVAVAQALADDGLWVSLERSAGEEGSGAEQVLADCRALVDRIADGGPAVAELAVLPESLADDASGSGAFDRLEVLARHAADRGVPVMVGMGPAADVAATLAWCEPRLGTLVAGVTVQASLRRTLDDCRRLSGHRVRLVKGAFRSVPGVSYGQPIEVDKSYVRCAKALLAGTGDPSFATHDPRLVDIVVDRAAASGRGVDGYELAFYLGHREAQARRLAEEGHRVRVYVPYGPDWFARIVGGLAERPSGIAAAVRSLLPG